MCLHCLLTSFYRRRFYTPCVYQRSALLDSSGAQKCINYWLLWNSNFNCFRSENGRRWVRRYTHIISFKEFSTKNDFGLRLDKKIPRPRKKKSCTGLSIRRTFCIGNSQRTKESTMMQWKTNLWNGATYCPVSGMMILQGMISNWICSWSRWN